MRTTTVVKKTARLRSIVILAVLAAMIASSAEGYCQTVSPACHNGNGGNTGSITYYPALTGPYKVGKTTFDWVDRSRLEPATNNKTYRELEVYIWYPAQPRRGASEGMLMDEAMAQAYFYPNGTKTVDHTYADAPVAGCMPYPVILASPADEDTPLWLTSMATNLASHGYIVVGITDPYNAYFTELDNHRSIGFDPDYAVSTLDVVNMSNDAYISEALSRSAVLENRRLADTSFVLGKLAELNRNDRTFRGRLDLGRVGMFGHSIGGDAAIYSLAKLPQVDAAVDLDGSIMNNVSASGVNKPLMIMNSVPSAPTPDELAMYNRTLEEFEDLLNGINALRLPTFQNSPTAYSVTVDGSAHYNFADPGMLGLEAYWPGSIDGRYAMRINNAYVQAFFDRYLKGIYSPLLSGKSPYPEVTFEGHVNGRPIK